MYVLRLIVILKSGFCDIIGTVASTFYQFFVSSPDFWAAEGSNPTHTGLAVTSNQVSMNLIFSSEWNITNSIPFKNSVQS